MTDVTLLGTDVVLLTNVGTCPCCSRSFVFQSLNGIPLPRIGPFDLEALRERGITPHHLAADAHMWRLKVIERAAREDFLSSFFWQDDEHAEDTSADATAH